MRISVRKNRQSQSHVSAVLLGLLHIVDGLVAVLSFGWLYSDFSMQYMLWYVIKAGERNGYEVHQSDFPN